MTEWSGPFDTSDFAEDEWRDLFSAILPDGLLRLSDAGTDGLTPTPSPSDRTISISPGRALVQGHLYLSDATVVLNNTPAPSSGTTRIDYVVLRFDPGEPLADRIKLAIVQGTESAGTPIAPSLTQDPDGIWEWPRVRYGPHDDGAMSNAPQSFMGIASTPVFSGTSDPNSRQVGLARHKGATIIGLDGKIWQYSTSSMQFEWVEAPSSGAIPTAVGFTEGGPSSRSPRWTKDKSGLVRLHGTIRRNGSAISLPDAAGSTNVRISAPLPSSIQQSGLAGENTYAVAWAQLSLTSTGAARNEPVSVRYDSDDDRLYVFHLSRETRWLKNGEGVILDGVTWRV
jgi:hypothetical protein